MRAFDAGCRMHIKRGPIQINTHVHLHAAASQRGSCGNTTAVTPEQASCRKRRGRQPPSTRPCIHASSLGRPAQKSCEGQPARPSQRQQHNTAATTTATTNSSNNNSKQPDQKWHSTSSFRCCRQHARQCLRFFQVWPMPIYMTHTPAGWVVVQPVWV